MIDADALFSMLIFLAAFAAIGTLGWITSSWLNSEGRRVLARLRDLAVDDATPIVARANTGSLLQSALPKVGEWLVSRKPDVGGHVKQRLVQAGYFTPNAVRVFFAAQLLLMLLLPIVSALVPYAMGELRLAWALVVTLSAVGVGMWTPHGWLEHRVRRRRRLLRRGLPDALDMLVLCLEGGISMSAAVQRVTGELWLAHPELGGEMAILQREMLLGLSAGEALKKMAERCGLDEVRDLASVLLQSERFGASMVSALRTHAESWRLERQRHAEELAHKAAVKILFPTLLCIFPAIFIVLLGPAAFQMAKLFSK